MAGSFCNSCPFRLIDKYCCSKSIGNINSDTLIVINNMTFKEKGDLFQNEEVITLNNIYKATTNSTCNIWDVYRITAFVKCAPTDKYHIDDNIRNKCILYLYAEINKYEFKKIVTFGNVSDFIIGNTDKTKDNIYYDGVRGWFSMFRASTLLYGGIVHETTMTRLVNFFYSNHVSNFSDYNIINL